MKRKLELSQQESLVQVRNEDIVLTEKIREELRLLKNRKVDLSDPDAPEISDWQQGVVGKFYRLIKKQITLRIDADIIEWFKNHTEKYQPLINQACREYILNHQKD